MMCATFASDSAEKGNAIDVFGQIATGDSETWKSSLLIHLNGMTKIVIIKLCKDVISIENLIK